jgi:formyl-CoA transferase
MAIEEKELFAGKHVLAVEQALSLPFCTWLLTMKGFDVIRVEPPIGDPNRRVGNQIADETHMAYYFLTINSGKKSITLNLKKDEGKEIFHELIKKWRVDIFCTNQLPAQYERLGIDYETLKGLNETLIWAGISGFGPDRSEAAYDPMIQAQTGVMDVTGEPDRDPMMLGIPIADLIASYAAYTGIMEALYKLEKLGKGSRIDISMTRATLAMLAVKLPLAAAGMDMTRNGNTHKVFAPVSTFRTADGFIMIAVGNDRQWAELVKFPGFESLDRPEYNRNVGRISNVNKLNTEIRDITKTRQTDELIKLFRDVNIPISRVNSLADVLADPYLENMTLRSRDPVTGVELTLTPPLDEIPYLDRNQTFPPRLGEHNGEILGEFLGYDLDKLRSQDIIL